MFERLSVFVVAAFAFAGGVAFERSIGNEGVRVVFLSVGQGDSTLLMSDDWVAVVDVGVRTEGFDAGERLVAPALRRYGVKKIDCLVLTHPDLDHVGGLTAVASRFRIGRVIVSRAFRNDPEMLEALGKARISPSQVEWVEGVSKTVMGELQIVIAAPPWYRGAESNDGSLFMRVDVGEASLAMTGDANSQVEEKMARVWDWDVDVLKAGHHGSRFSTSSEWLAVTSPEFVVASCGRRNTYGHPATDMVTRVRESGAGFYRTDRDGSVEFVVRSGQFVLVE